MHFSIDMLLGRVLLFFGFVTVFAIRVSPWLLIQISDIFGFYKSRLAKSIPVMSALLRLTTGLVAVSSLASAAVEIGHGRIESSVEARADYDSNIFANSGEVSDEIFTLTPEVHYIRDQGIFTTNLGVGVNLVRFSDHASQDSEDPYFSGRIAYSPSDKALLTSDVGIKRTSQADDTLNARVTSNDYTYNGLFQYLFSEKLGYRLTANYDLNDYRTAGYSDVEAYTVGIDGVYVYSPKLTALAGFSYGQSKTTNRAAGHGDPASQDFRYSAGLEGELAPKVTGTVRAGLVNRQFDNSGFHDATGIFLATGLKWVATQKTSFTLDASNDFGTTAGDQSSKTFTISLGIKQALSEKLSLDGGVGYDHANYTASGALSGRTDDSESARIRLAYTFTPVWSADVSAGYRHTESTLAISTYDRITYGVGVTARF